MPTNSAICPSIQQLQQLGPLPHSDLARDGQLEEYEHLLSLAVKPISDNEAQVLISLFGPDDCFGIAWTLVHLIETAPSWPIWTLLTDDSNEWVRVLRTRVLKTTS